MKKARVLHLKLEWLSNETLAVIPNEIEAWPEEYYTTGLEDAWARTWNELTGRVGEEETLNLQSDARVALATISAFHNERYAYARAGEEAPASED